MVGPSRPPSVPVRLQPADATADIARPWQPGSAAPSIVTTRVAQRLDERRVMARRNRHRTWRRRAIVALVVVGAMWAIGASGLFAMRSHDVSVVGTSEYVAGADVDAIVSAYTGQSLLWMNTSALARQVAAIPGVRSVEVVRVWPSSLSITVTTRTPVAAIPRATEWVVVDDEGHAIAVVASVPHGVPVIVVPLGADHVRVQEAVLAVLYELPADIREQVVSVSADTQDSVTFTLTDGPMVEWGSADQSALKAQVLVAMLASPAGRDAAIIDVSAPTLPVTRSAGEK